MICITGWSVWTELELFRGEDKQIYDGTLGQLLCKKADQGVKVKVMVWSEYTSGSVKEKGVMGTHDMATYKYFKDPKNYDSSNRVICALAPRKFSKKVEFTDALQDIFGNQCSVRFLASKVGGRSRCTLYSTLINSFTDLYIVYCPTSK